MDKKLRENLSSGLTSYDSIDNIEIPKDHKWLKCLLLIKRKYPDCKLKFVYGYNEVSDKLNKFAWDEKKGGIGVVRPQKVLIVKEEREGYVTREKVIGEVFLDDSFRVDPDFKESMRILEIVRRVEE